MVNSQDRKVAIAATIKLKNLIKAENYCEENNVKMSHLIDELLENNI